MRHSITISDLSEIDRAAGEFLRQIGDRKILAFHAPMGAGKTTFIAAICRCLGVRDSAVGSPSFAIVNEYAAASGEPVYHFDFYRISKPGEALDIGLYEYLDSGFLCLIEWPENIKGLLPEETLKISIAVRADSARTLSWEI